VRRPDFFIVGAPKCGTTALCSYLREHPDIFMPLWKEPHYFGTDLRRSQPVDLETYLSYFAEAGEQLRVGEASTSYLYSKTCGGNQVVQPRRQHHRDAPGIPPT
jgi:hypothetical protein